MVTLEQTAEERLKPTFAAMLEKEAAEMPYIKEQAFDPFAGRGMGLSSWAERGVSRAIAGQQEKYASAKDTLFQEALDRLYGEQEREKDRAVQEEAAKPWWERLSG